MILELRDKNFNTSEWENAEANWIKHHMMLTFPTIVIKRYCARISSKFHNQSQNLSLQENTWTILEQFFHKMCIDYLRWSEQENKADMPAKLEWFFNYSNICKLASVSRTSRGYQCSLWQRYLSKDSSTCTIIIHPSLSVSKPSRSHIPYAENFLTSVTVNFNSVNKSQKVDTGKNKVDKRQPQIRTLVVYTSSAWCRDKWIWTVKLLEINDQTC